MPCEPAWLLAQIEAAADAGFNIIVLDAFFRGFTCFPAQTPRAYGLPSLAPSYRGTNLLELACEVARARRLHVVAAMDCLNAGDWNDFPKSPFSKHRFRTWRTAARTGAFGRHRDCEGSDILLCPSNPLLRDFLATLASELTDAYPIDGLMLCALQFGPPDGAHAGRCYCSSCTAADTESTELVTFDEKWDLLRLKRISELISAIKARARQSRRNLRIWGEMPVLPGAVNGTQLLEAEFDHECLDVCVAPLAEALKNSVLPQGLTLPSFAAGSEQAIATHIESCKSLTPLGYICNWTSASALDFDSLDESHSSNLPFDQNPLSAARYWLQRSGQQAEGGPSQRARECLSLWDKTDADDGAPLDKMHAILEPALPQEGSAATSDPETRAMATAFALLRLAIMLRE